MDIIFFSFVKPQIWRVFVFAPRYGVDLDYLEGHNFDPPS